METVIITGIITGLQEQHFSNFDLDKIKCLHIEVTPSGTNKPKQVVLKGNVIGMLCKYDLEREISFICYYENECFTVTGIEQCKIPYSKYRK